MRSGAEVDWEVVHAPGSAGARATTMSRFLGILMPVLVPASWVYQVVSGAIRGARSAAGPDRRPTSLVVSVGNLVVGGGGKTPLAMALIESIAADGGMPVYISRGFGGQAGRLDLVTVVEPARATVGRYPPAGGPAVRILRREGGPPASVVGDEGAMVARRMPGVPLLFCKDKSAALEVAGAMYDPTHAVLDDAFQSWGVPRDVDVVVVDGNRPFGTGWLLPAGPLREPPEALGRADILGITVDNASELERSRAVIAAGVGAVAPSFGIRRRLLLDAAPGTPVVAVSGIALPRQFERQVASTGVRLAAALRFPDHHRYGVRDVEWIVAQADDRGAVTIVTTEKDWTKLRHLDPPPGRFSPSRLELEFVGGDPLDLIKRAAD